MITKVENVIESGLFETILHCNWVHTGFSYGRRSGEDCQKQTLSREYGGEAPEADVTTEATRYLAEQDY